MASDARDKQDQPNPALVEFAELVGPGQLRPYQRELLEMIEPIGPNGRLTLRWPPTRPGWKWRSDRSFGASDA
jgi:hypothetical protein